MRLLKFNNFSRILFLSVAFLAAQDSFCATQTLIMSEGKRLEANIAIDAMNRLTVTNDRITQLFGDEGSFVTQNDEQTGQVFIKPSLNNGSKPLSITLITENGLTQDLNLTPIDSEPSTLILRNLNKAPPKNKNLGCEGSLSNTAVPGEPAASEQWVQLMKQAVLGELPIYEKKLPQRSTLKCQTHFIKAYQAGSYLINVWSVKSATEEVLCERLFYQPGDLAICLQDRCLRNDKKTLLYVLTKG